MKPQTRAVGDFEALGSKEWEEQVQISGRPGKSASSPSLFLKSSGRERMVR